MVLAVGDIHGCADELRLLLEKLEVTPETTILFLGDYIDRGPKSRQVIEVILELAERCNVVTLKGNHEAMLGDFLVNPTSSKAAAYIFNGGSSTLASYSEGDGEYSFPLSHLTFFERLRVCHETEQNLFVHAGIPDIPIEELNPSDHGRDMLWLRDSFLRSEFRWSKIVVHGHTPVEEVTFTTNRINVDTGCVFQGHLSAVELPSERIVRVPRQIVGGRRYLRARGCQRAAVRFRGSAPVQIQRGDEIYEFETLDYSELGLFICAVDNEALFDEGELIRGVIGTFRWSSVEFFGQVVRRTRDDRGLCYGVRVLSVVPK